VLQHGAAAGPDVRDQRSGHGHGAPITAVRVFNAAGTKVEDSALPGSQDPNV
jgi:hypothetical protein